MNKKNWAPKLLRTVSSAPNNSLLSLLHITPSDTNRQDAAFEMAKSCCQSWFRHTRGGANRTGGHAIPDSITKVLEV